MQIVQAARVEGAQAAEGHVVVIDVLRAFTTAAFAFSAGAKEIILVDTPEAAFAHRERDPAVLLAGEVHGKRVPGFDVGNSPEAIEAMADSGAPLAGRTVVLRTSNGARGVVACARADRILLGSLVAAQATVDYLLSAAPDLVTIVACGSSSGKDGAEDTVCAELLEARLRGQDLPTDEVVRRVRASGGGRAALDPAQPWITAGDLDRAALVDRFDFAMLVERTETGYVARRHENAACETPSVNA